MKEAATGQVAAILDGDLNEAAHLVQDRRLSYAGGQGGATPSRPAGQGIAFEILVAD